MDGDESAVVGPDSVEDETEELVALCWVGFSFPEESEVGEGTGGFGHVDDDRWLEGVDLLLQELAPVVVLALGEVSEDEELLEAFELAFELCALRCCVALTAGFGLFLEPAHDRFADLGWRDKLANVGCELLFRGFCGRDWLVAGAGLLACGAVVAADAVTSADGSVHASAATVAVEELGEDVAFAGSARVQRCCLLRSDLLHSLEEVIAHDRRVETANLSCLVASS